MGFHPCALTKNFGVINYCAQWHLARRGAGVHHHQRHYNIDTRRHVGRKMPKKYAEVNLGALYTPWRPHINLAELKSRWHNDVRKLSARREQMMNFKNPSSTCSSKKVRPKLYSSRGKSLSLAHLLSQYFFFYIPTQQKQFL